MLLGLRRTSAAAQLRVEPIQAGRDSDFLTRQAPLIFLIWALWLAFEYFGFGPLSYVRLHDTGDATLPAFISAAHMRLSLWAEQWVSGIDRNAQGWLADPLLLPFRFFPGWVAYGFILVAQRFIAAYFMFRLVREHLGLRYWSAIFCALTYSLFSQVALNGSYGGFTLYDEFGIPGLPLVLWLMGRAARTVGYRSFVYACIASAVFGIGCAPASSIFLAPMEIGRAH